MKYILGLLAGLLLCTPVSSGGLRPGEYAVQYVCGVLHEDCAHLPAPEIRYADLIVLRNWLGYFYSAVDPHRVWIDIRYEGALRAVDLSQAEAMSVLVHEVTHYVDWHLYGTADNCAAEALAFDVMNLWLLEHGRADLARWNWRARYGC